MYDIILTNSAEKFLKRVERQDQIRIRDKLKELKENPHRGIPLTGNLSGLWKLRVGNYRVTYQIKNQELIVLIIRIGHRKNIYD